MSLSFLVNRGQAAAGIAAPKKSCTGTVPAKDAEKSFGLALVVAQGAEELLLLRGGWLEPGMFVGNSYIGMTASLRRRS